MAETKPLANQLILELKEILERKNGRSYSYDEAARIGRGLVGIYDELADNPLGIGVIKKKKGDADDSPQLTHKNR
ncbi:MAG TPA: hypothetical protein VMR28_03240 [Candidatus Saccharimonadales bacterium]|nr:hypothetical protein [Candidatus Saccharimonadales bacterium]